jgi:hypothetical protein
LNAAGFVIFEILPIKTTLVFLFYGSESWRNPRPAFTGATLPFLAGYIHLLAVGALFSSVALSGYLCCF